MNAREKEIRDRLTNAPPWPWEVDGRRIVSKRPDRATNLTVAEVYGLSVVKVFIANAPADIQWLLDQLKSARSEERKRTIEEMKKIADGYVERESNEAGLLWRKPGEGKHKHAADVASEISEDIARSLDKRQDDSLPISE